MAPVVLAAACATGSPSSPGPDIFADAEAAAGAAMDPPGAVALSPKAARARLAIDPMVDPYRPRLPPALSRGWVVVRLVMRVCVSESGQVSDVVVLHGDPLVKDHAARKVRS
jgi:hypothetical protein